MAAVFSMSNGLTLPAYLLFFLAPALVWLALLALTRTFWIGLLQRLHPVEAGVTRAAVGLISVVLLLRIAVATIAWSRLTSLTVIEPFYPIRIAIPNFGVVAGLPWFALAIAMVVVWPRIALWLSQVHYRFIALWLIAFAVLLIFAAIQGGLINGVSGIFASKQHLSDLQHVSWSSTFFHEHLQRVGGALQPAYLTSHYTTHPPLSLQLFSLVNQLGPFGMGLVTLALFALAFPLLDTLLADEDGAGRNNCIIALLFTTPGFLVYGGSDDAWYYLLWALALVLAWRGIRGKQLVWTIAAGLVIALACNLTYASLVMVPGVMAFTTQRSLGELPGYVKEYFVYLLVVALTVALALGAVAMLIGFNLLEGMAVVLRFQNYYMFKNLVLVNPAHAISERLMTVFDFVIFAGPVMLASWIMVIKQRRPRWLQWSIPGVAFVVLTAYVAFSMPGAGESGRGWGGLYLLWWVGCGMGLARQWSSTTVNNLVRFALTWAALLQLVVDFGW